MAPVPEQGPRARPIAQSPVHRLIRTHKPQNQTFRILFARNECPVTTQILPGEYLSVDMFVYTHAHRHTPQSYSLHHPVSVNIFSPRNECQAEGRQLGLAWLTRWMTQRSQASSLGRGHPALFRPCLLSPPRPLGTLRVQVPCGHTMEARKAAAGRDPSPDPPPLSPEPRKPR